MKKETEDYRLALRKKYLEEGIDSMSGLEVLELFLFYAVKGDGARDAAKGLYSDFDSSLERVFTAEISELAATGEIGKNCAALIHLVGDVEKMSKKSRNNSVKIIDSPFAAKEYVKNILDGLELERVILITLSNKNEILSCRELSSGGVNSAGIEIVDVFRRVIDDGAASVIVAHNHPRGNCAPSKKDIKFTENLSAALKNAGLSLVDHLIVGEDDTCSMRGCGEYSFCFE